MTLGSQSRPHQIATALLLTLGGLPLLIYPLIFFANMMSLGAEATGREPLLLRFIAGGFLWSSLLYPLVYLCFRKLAKRRLTAGNGRAACLHSALPLAYLAVVLLFFALWTRGVGA